MVSEFTKRVIEIVSGIPRGFAMSYGAVARMAGSPRGARQVVRILRSCSDKHDLPWHRVVNSKGEIAFSDPFARDEQRALLESEGVNFDSTGRVEKNCLVE
jgi:methylated-DNA-protein-cysteine methyltransferase-like protein